MARNKTSAYTPSDFGQQEVELHSKFMLQMEDARQHFLQNVKPRLDRSYKLYIAYNGDRRSQIKRWQANVFVPYVNAVVETIMPRVLDARPEFSVKGREEDDEIKAEKQQQLTDYVWEIAEMDKTSEDVVRAALVYGTGYLQVSWKKDARTLEFLDTKDVNSKKPKYKKETRIFYDAPFCEWVDNYSLWYDWHNTERKSKQYWFKRLVLTGAEIERKYPNADKKRLDMALNGSSGDLTDYAAIRNQVKDNHETIAKQGGSVSLSPYPGYGGDKYNDGTIDMYEVFEWWRPFDDSYCVLVGGSYVPILKGGDMPIPYDFKEAPFIDVPYLRIQGEFEGMGIPMLLENPQIMLNLIKNQRLDAATLSIHKMWIVNPLANINKEELVTRPFGIIYSVDPAGVREVEFSDIKASAYKEEELLKGDMRYSSGVDDFSMGVGGGASSATEVRHLRESTLERVRLFVNHLGQAYADVMRYWMDMSRQFFTKDMIIRVIGDDGKTAFPLIEKSDLQGRFDYRASVLPSIAGQLDVKKKQDMDLYQLLIGLPFVDQQKLTAKILSDWSWSLESVSKGEDAPQEGMEQGMVPGAEGQVPPEMAEMFAGAGAQPGAETADFGLPEFQPKQIPMDVLRGAVSSLRTPAELASAQQSQFDEASMPINLLAAGAMPPTVKGVPKGGTTNPRGFNRGGKVNTNISTSGKSNPEAALMNRTFNIQR